MKDKSYSFWQRLRKMWLLWSAGLTILLYGLCLVILSIMYVSPAIGSNMFFYAMPTGIVLLGLGLVLIAIGVGVIKSVRRAMRIGAVVSILSGVGFWLLMKAFSGTAPSSSSWGGAISGLFIALLFVVGVVLIVYAQYNVKRGESVRLRARVILLLVCGTLILIPFTYQGYRYIADRSGHSLGPDFIFAQRYAAMSMDLNLQEFTYTTNLSPDDFLVKYPKIGTREDATTIYFDDSEISGMHANFCKLSDAPCRHKLDEMHPLNKVVYEKKYLVTFDSDFAYQRMAETVGVDTTIDY